MHSYNFTQPVDEANQVRRNPRRKVSRVPARDGRGFGPNGQPAMNQYAPRRLRDSGIGYRPAAATNAPPKNEEWLTRPFIFCVCGERTQKGGQPAPLMKPQTARRHRPTTATTTAAATATAYRTTTVHYHYDRMEEDVLSLREVGPNEVIG